MFELSQQITTTWKIVEETLKSREQGQAGEVRTEKEILAQDCNVAFYLPRNTDLEEVAKLGSMEDGKEVIGGEEEETDIVVEEQWMGHKLKAIVCYFGELAKWEEGKGW